IWSLTCTQVKAQLDGTKNINYAVLPAPTGETMTIPTITLDAGGGTLSATLIHSGEQIIVQVSGTGPDAGVKRKLQLAYARAERARAIFHHGVSSKTAITIGGNAKLLAPGGAASRGSRLSATHCPQPLW